MSDGIQLIADPLVRMSFFQPFRLIQDFVSVLSAADLQVTAG
jgi:hypothetical protein